MKASLPSWWVWLAQAVVPSPTSSQADHFSRVPLGSAGPSTARPSPWVSRLLFINEQHPPRCCCPCTMCHFATQHLLHTVVQTRFFSSFHRVPGACPGLAVHTNRWVCGQIKAYGKVVFIRMQNVSSSWCTGPAAQVLLLPSCQPIHPFSAQFKAVWAWLLTVSAAPAAQLEVLLHSTRKSGARPPDCTGVSWVWSWGRVTGFIVSLQKQFLIDIGANQRGGEISLNCVVFSSMVFCLWGRTCHGAGPPDHHAPWRQHWRTGPSVEVLGASGTCRRCIEL